MPRNRRNGLGRELDVRDFLIEHGWEAFRSAKEKADVIALARPDAVHPVFGLLDVGRVSRIWDHATMFGWRPLLVQVKSTKAGPYADFGPSERRVLIEAASRCGAAAWLAWWPPRGRLAWNPSGDWPRGRERTGRVQAVRGSV